MRKKNEYKPLDPSSKRELGLNDGYWLMGVMRNGSTDYPSFYPVKPDISEDDDFDIFYNENDSNEIPHIHIRNKDWSIHSAIRLDKAEYLLHEEGMQYLNDIILMNVINFIRYSFREAGWVWENWVKLKDMWNYANEKIKGRKISRKLAIPDYNQMIRGFSSDPDLQCFFGVIRNHNGKVEFMDDYQSEFLPSDIIIFFNTNDFSKIPHFHIRSIDRRIFTALRLDKAEYLLHKNDNMTLLSKDELKLINEFLKENSSCTNEKNRWCELVSEWNMNNENYEMNKDEFECPDYTKMSM